MLQIKLQSGYSYELKARLSRALSAVMTGITRADPDVMAVHIDEISAEDDSPSTVTERSDLDSVDPAMLVLDYLMAMQQRDLETAQACLAEHFVMHFPGSGELTSIARLLDWSRDRYRFVNKTISDVNVAYEKHTIVVFVHGTLAGQWPDGTTFEHVRFIDRFEVRDDRLERQDVWNDLAIALPRASP